MCPTSSRRNAPSVKYMPSSSPNSSRYRRTSSSNSSYQRGIESGQRVVVRVNRFQQEEERVVPTFRLDPALERSQVESLREVRAGRSRSAVAEKLAALQQAARGSGNLMPPILDAADVYATVGEIADRLRTVFGEHREV